MGWGWRVMIQFFALVCWASCGIVYSCILCCWCSKLAYILCLFWYTVWVCRAEECFKRAIQSDPPDAEALSQYADFLWLVRKDLWAAEETYQQAMAAEPNSSSYASKYASFLWNTGGEETCFPLSSSQDDYNHIVWSKRVEK